ncbi:MAG: glycosyltransferase, partial [Chloroflexia bacterium]
MRILFLTPRFPYPPLKGDTLRAYHQIRTLHDAGNTITLLSLADAPVASSDMAEITSLCEQVKVVRLPKSRAMLNMGFGLFNSRPLQVSHYISSEFRRLLAKTLRENAFDAIHVALIRMLPYVWNLPEPHPPITVDLIDSLALNLEDRRKSTRGPLRLAYELEYRRVLRYERETVRRFPALTVSSPADKQYLGNQNNIEVIPNGVDLDRFPYDPVRSHNETVIFTGNMGYGPNEEAVVWFATHVWPLLRKSHANLRFQVVGTNPSERVQALASAAQGIEVLGKVPDVAQCLRNATIAVAPMRSGSGIQNKLLEAMSSGTPVVSTSIGNRGVGAQHGVQLLVADSPEAFAQSIGSLIENPTTRADIARQARIFVEAHFQWSEHANSLTKLYRMPAAKHKASTAPMHTHKLNVMQLTDVTGRGGAEKALADIALHLDLNHYNVTICATREAGNYQPLLDEAGLRTFVQGRKSRWDFGQWLKLVQL